MSVAAVEDGINELVGSSDADGVIGVDVIGVVDGTGGVVVIGGVDDDAGVDESDVGGVIGVAEEEEADVAAGEGFGSPILCVGFSFNSVVSFIG